MSRTLHLAEQLISRPSITPLDAGCLELLAERLGTPGLCVRTAWTAGRRSSVSATCGHKGLQPQLASAAAVKTHSLCRPHPTCVPTGPLAQWSSPPFTPTHRDGKLFGRGASDMKTSIAAFVVAVEEFLAAAPDTPLDIAFLLTSDEEGPSVDGTKVVVRATAARAANRMDSCIVGEPTVGASRPAT